MIKEQTLDQARGILMDTLQNQIIHNLQYQFNGHVFPFHFITLTSAKVNEMVCHKETSTLQFGTVVNEMRREFYPRVDKPKIETLWGIFWWPAVNRLWPLQCFSMPVENHINQIWLLARTGPDEWIGVTSNRCFRDDN